MKMRRKAALFIYTCAVVLATYGVTRHAAAVRIASRNESAFWEFVQAEVQIRNKERSARGQGPDGWDFPDHVKRLHKRLVIVDGISGEYIHEMIMWVAVAGMLAAVAAFVARTKRNSEQSPAGDRLKAPPEE